MQLHDTVRLERSSADKQVTNGPLKPEHASEWTTTNIEDVELQKGNDNNNFVNINQLSILTPGRNCGVLGSVRVPTTAPSI